MVHWFTYNGKDSRDFNIFITQKNAHDKPDRDLSFVPVAGRSGDLIIDNGRYDNIDIKLGLRMFAEDYGEVEENDAFFRSYKEVAEWLKQSATYLRYTDSYNPDYFRYACIKSGLSINQRRKDIADFTVTFNCKPYKYRVDGDKTISHTFSGYDDCFFLNNPESEKSLPKIKVYTNVEYNASAGVFHSFAIFNEEQNVGAIFTIDRINGSCVIDSEMMNVYSGNYNKNKDYISDSFPILYPGENRIMVLDNVSKIDIIPRWRAI